MERVILLVDDEENILAALTRLLRPQGYRLLRANNTQQGLELLAQHDVGVIVTDQRMPGMNGAEFLNQVKERWPKTMRIMLSGYTDLASVTDSINRGAIYKFLTKPWEDDQLKAAIEEAFHYYEMERENQRLSDEIFLANAELTLLNQKLERKVAEEAAQAHSNLHALEVAQEIVDNMPIGVVGVDCDGIVATVNRVALDCLSGTCLPGEKVEDCLPVALHDLGEAWRPVTLPSGAAIEVSRHPMGQTSAARGWIVLLRPRGD